MPVLMKGSAARFRHTYIRHKYGEAMWSCILERLADEERKHLDAADRNESIPVAVEGAVMRAFVEECMGGNKSVAEQELRVAGAAQADDMLDGVFSIFARFVSPQQAFVRGGSILGSVYTGIETSTDATEDDVGGCIRLKGLGDFTYVSPWIQGWIHRAVERFGGANARVSERSWASGEISSDVLEFDVSWS